MWIDVVKLCNGHILSAEKKHNGNLLDNSSNFTARVDFFLYNVVALCPVLLNRFKKLFF